MTFINTFHQHLDTCKRCREQPFNLCSVGAQTFQDTIDKLTQAAAIKPLRIIVEEINGTSRA